MKLGQIDNDNTLKSIFTTEIQEEKRLIRVKNKKILKRIEDNKDKAIKASADLILWKSGESDYIPSMTYIKNQDIQLHIW